MHDAVDTCAALKRVGFTTLCYTNLRNRDDFAARVQEFVDQLGPDTTSVFYYSGHAVQVGNENYLVPTETQVASLHQDFTQQFYRLNELFDKLNGRPAAFQMVVLDACRTDPFADAPLPSTPAMSGVNTASRAVVLKSLRVDANATYGLQRINHAPVGTLVLYATASGDAAFDGIGRNGPLTKHFLAHLESPGISVEELIKRVTRGVQSDTSKGFGKQQTPFVYSSFTGNFCFAGCPQPMFVTPTN
ncbi:MAG: caspase family protein [Burkholderiaceae bacterium]|nr:caspase family protein [Burkholderiaceae bacterium]